MAATKCVTHKLRPILFISVCVDRELICTPPLPIKKAYANLSNKSHNLFHHYITLCANRCEESLPQCLQTHTAHVLYSSAAAVQAFLASSIY